MEGNQMIYYVKIPANTTATITLPEASVENVLINSLPLKNDSDKQAKQIMDDVTLELGSGEYQFQFPIIKNLN